MGLPRYQGCTDIIDGAAQRLVAVRGSFQDDMMPQRAVALYQFKRPALQSPDAETR